MLISCLPFIYNFDNGFIYDKIFINYKKLKHSQLFTSCRFLVCNSIVQKLDRLELLFFDLLIHCCYRLYKQKVQLSNKSLKENASNVLFFIIIAHIYIVYSFHCFDNFNCQNRRRLNSRLYYFLFVASAYPKKDNIFSLFFNFETTPWQE